MGAALSNNVTNNTVSAVSNVASSIVSNSSNTLTQQQIIRVDNTGGNVTIKGGKQSQTAELDMSALMSAFTSQTASQSIVNELTQSAKSLVSGLNIAQASIAVNQVRNYLSASMNLVSNISQSCRASVGQTQQIIVTNTTGNADVLNKTQEQMSGIFTKCVQNASNGQSAVQSLQNTIDQSADATAQGLSEWALILMPILLLLSIGLPVAIGGAMVANMIMIIIFVGMVIAGIGLLIYAALLQETMITVPFSTGIDELCGPTVATNSKIDTSTDSSKPEQWKTVFNRCMEDPACRAVDWKGVTVNTDGSHTPMKTPVVTVYSGLKENPCKATMSKFDDTKLVRFASLIVDRGKPSEERTQNAKEGTVYVDSGNSQVYIFKQGSGFQITEKALLEPLGVLTNITTGFGDPTTSTAKGYYMNANFTNKIRLWYWGKQDTNAKEDTWYVKGEVDGPGGIVEYPEQVNVSGFKIMPHKTMYLALGGAMTLMGVGAIAFLVFRRYKRKTPPNPANKKVPPPTPTPTPTPSP